MNIEDPAYIATEAIIKELERRIAKEYKQASKEVQATLDDYLRRFEVKDKKWQEWVDTGYKTQAQYDNWRTGQLAVGKRWEELKDNLAEDYHNANVIARAMVAGELPTVYAINHDYGTWEIENGAKVNTSYTLYNREAAEIILKDQPALLKPPGNQLKATFAKFDQYKSGQEVKLTKEEKAAFDRLIANGKDIRWQKGQIQSVMLQSLLQGESIPNIAKRIANTMGEINYKSSVRYARTAITGIQNKGRLDAYKRGEEMGIRNEKMWMATLDNRTRHAHRELDGETRPLDEPFENSIGPIMEPGDPDAAPDNVYNCRCSLRSVVLGLERLSGLHRDTNAINDDYYAWREEHESESNSLTLPEEKGEAIKWSYIKEYRTH